MNQIKIITGLTVATLSAVVGNVYAEDITPTAPVNEPQVSSETAKTPQVTESQVNSAKVTADQATSDVNNQQIVVDEAQKQKDQSQQNLAKATSTVTEASTIAAEATPEVVKEATKAVTEAKEAITDAEANVADAQKTEQKANQEVQSQAKTVDGNVKVVADKESEVKQAEGAVTTAQEAIDSKTANTNASEAEKAVTDKQTKLETAETNLIEAQKQDAKIAEEKRLAEQEVVSKQLAVTDTQTLLKKLVTEINNEKVSTSLENQAYFNQRDGAWARYYGNYTFAATGCVPSSLAMVFTELARRQITPTEIANYLWNNSNEFNKNYGGTSGKGLVQATKHFGFVPTHLASQSAIVEALQAGHHVLAAVQQDKFSPWGINYSHEIVLRGYSNGNTYVYDPYNRANIGWYPVANLWNEQSRDAIDTSSVGVPFFKITTQKMAQLEAQKAQVQSSLNTAKNQLAKTQDVLRTLEATPLKTPEAQAKLNQAKEALALAQADYTKAQEAVKLASQDLAVKEETLKNAQADLLTKQTALKDAQTVLVASQVKLADLKATLATVENNVKKAQATLTEAKAIVGQKQAKLLALQNAPKILADAQAKLVTAKNDLANKMAILDEAVAKLKSLQAVQAEAQKQYHVVFEAYKAVRDAKEQAKLAESYNHIIAGGGEAIPVVDETGKVTGYVDGSQKSVANEVTLALTSNGAPLESPVNKENQNVTKSSQALPHTGEAGLSILSVLGVGLISTLGLTSLKKRRPH
ncbi:TPA: C39 family peptidase [Streptococcus agalactiae]|uniref:C39 family peptidase n=10 Tax=Streptococcus agalactiae TaxID=1311 RepID=UPI000640396A|nr:C39 family peptidase [Streptococcus agalactiae]KLL36630.1 cell wall anchor protein [Streptococcus agalactiae]KLL83497.1 cell wall anchor protein [Streptococcus agalactiae]MCC9873243.1 LPXTG cell wall anchor domain-containing protein [Streptococcus agalactiae]MCC9878730.1 LPXTG cell wall anchor domain-containing protein [Streptococcus agalactiae]MCC9889078.1 LPXTG cell wall anchor domain-containing protein [Streptococcus agalactiae]